MNKSERFWDKRALEYDRQDKKYELSSNKAVENTINYLKNDNIVLDYGCGYGLITSKLAKSVKEIHGIDISPKMIEVAKRKADEHSFENIIYTQSTIFDDVLKEESFDVVVAYSLLHLLEDLQKSVERINNLLKPGGLFISDTVCMGEKKSALGFFLLLLSKIRLIPQVKKLKFSELEGLIANGGFQIIKAEDLHQTSLDYFIVAKKT